MNEEAERIARALERIADCLEKLTEPSAHDGALVLRMRDVDRATVYSTHLGEKLRPAEKP